MHVAVSRTCVERCTGPCGRQADLQRRGHGCGLEGPRAACPARIPRRALSHAYGTRSARNRCAGRPDRRPPRAWRISSAASGSDGVLRSPGPGCCPSRGTTRVCLEVKPVGRYERPGTGGDVRGTGDNLATLGPPHVRRVGKVTLEWLFTHPVEPDPTFRAGRRPGRRTVLGGGTPIQTPSPRVVRSHITRVPPSAE